MNGKRTTDKLAELEARLDQYLQHSLDAEKVALTKLGEYPQAEEQLSPVEVLRRERLRHHTQSLLLKEIKQWIEELRQAQTSEVLETSEVCRRSP